MSGAFDAFLAGCASGTVEHGSGEWTHAHRRDDPLRLAEWRTILAQAAKRAACPDCGGSGTVAVHVCEDERECARTCLRVEACIACGGTGRRPALQQRCPSCADHFTPEGTER